MVDLQAQIKQIFEEERAKEHEFSSIDAYNKISKYLSKECSQSGNYYPLDDENIQLECKDKKAQSACNAYGAAAKIFIDLGFTQAGISLLEEGWESFSEIQRVEGKRIYRAGIGMYLARVYEDMSDHGATIRWALLAHADDLLGEHPQGGGNVKQLLQTQLGMSEKAFIDLDKIANKNLAVVKSLQDGWKTPFAFPEDIVTKFSFEKSEYAHMFSAPTKRIEFPLNKAYGKALLDAVTSAKDSQTKGNTLEDLASYLFLLIPGLSPRRNSKDLDTGIETDIVVRDFSSSNDVKSELMGRHFLVECKNWDKPIRVSEVGYFLYRVRLVRAKFGVIISKNSITGDGRGEAAESLISKAFHEDGTLCIVFDYDALEQLINGQVSFWSLVLEKIETRRFGKQ